MIKIAIIERHPIARIGLDRYLNEIVEKVKIMVFDDVQGFSKESDYRNMDLIILGISHESKELNLSKINSLIKDSNVKKLILMDDDIKFDMIRIYLKLGAMGYIHKKGDISELTDCVRDVLDGKRYVCKQGVQLFLENLCSVEKSKTKKDQLFTQREYEVAQYLADGLETSEIARVLGREKSTISSIKNRIYRKVGVQNIVRLREAMHGVKQ